MTVTTLRFLRPVRPAVAVAALLALGTIAFAQVGGRGRALLSAEN